MTPHNPLGAIPTEYLDTRFRSRVEAKYAGLFEWMGIDWVYEPCDMGGWIPDFSLKFDDQNSVLVEVKGCSTRNELERNTKVKLTRHVRAGTSIWLLGDRPSVNLLIPGTYETDRHPYLNAHKLQWIQESSGAGGFGVIPYGAQIPDAFCDPSSVISRKWRTLANDVQWRPV